MTQKSVFISYRRASSKHLARAIYQDLKAHGWDAFLDVNTIDSGDFDRIILNQIAARAHFVLLISPAALQRCANPGDWVLREIQEAVRLQRNIVPVVEEGADFSREMAYLPADLRAIISKKNALPLPHFFFDAAVEILRTRFLKTPEYVKIIAPSAADSAEVQRRLATIDPSPPPSPPPAHSALGNTPTSVRTASHPTPLPAPFAWIDLPGKGYSISKYPITNAQYKLFVEAAGYRERKWWTEAGWKARQQGWLWNPSASAWKPSATPWTERKYWTDAEWNGAEKPVVGVSWFEAVAFCLWLSHLTGEKIMLPTEDQWQYAAQGADGRTYPWGSVWDASRCNHNVGRKGIGKTTSVRQYEGKGDSPFGVVDMAGNTLEWCLTDYNSQSNDIHHNSVRRVLRGGSWNQITPDNFRCDDRYWFDPRNRRSEVSFRLARIQE